MIAAEVAAALDAGARHRRNPEVRRFIRIAGAPPMSNCRAARCCVTPTNCSRWMS
jgi:hypothetical protein